MSDNSGLQHFESELASAKDRIRKLEKHNLKTTETKPERSRWEDPVAIATLLLVLVTMGLVVITKLGVDDAHKSFEAGTRAWVIAEQSEIVPTASDAPHHAVVQEGRGLKDSRSPAISVSFTNTGKSPAFNVYQKTFFNVFDKLPDNSYNIPQSEQRPSTTVLGPNQSIAVKHAQVLSEDQYHAVRNGSLFIVIVGDLTYDDIFKKTHETKYCLFYDYITESMSFCPYHNSAK